MISLTWRNHVAILYFKQLFGQMYTYWEQPLQLLWVMNYKEIWFLTPASSGSEASLCMWCNTRKYFDLGLAKSFSRVFIKQIEALAGFFSVIYWMALKHFYGILSTGWSDFTTQAFGLWKEGCCTSRLNDVYINILQPAFTVQLWNYKLGSHVPFKII